MANSTEPDTLGLEDTDLEDSSELTPTTTFGNDKTPAQDYDGQSPAMLSPAAVNVNATDKDSPLENSIELDDFTNSPSLSCTLGLEDTDVEESVKKPRATKQDSLRDKNSGVKAPWVNLFKNNRTPDDSLKLKSFHSDGDEVIIDDADPDDIDVTWGYSLVGYFVGKFPGKTSLLKLYDSWGVKYKFYPHPSGWLIFKFDMDLDRRIVVGCGPYLAYRRPLVLKFDDKEVSTMPAWINLLDLPLEIWNTNVIGKIVTKIGEPVSIDKVTFTKDRLAFARALVEIDASEELVREVKLKFASDKTRKQEVIYENEPKFCSICKVFGHTIISCRHKNVQVDGGYKKPKQGQKAGAKAKQGQNIAENSDTDIEDNETEVEETDQSVQA